MTATLAAAIAPDRVVSFRIHPGTLRQLLDTRAEGGPLLKCFEGSVTLVSPCRPHETMRRRLDHLVMAVCLELGIKHTALGSTTWAPPPGAGDAAYEPDQAYHVQNHAATDANLPPDLAVEIVVGNPERKALLAGALLGIPELWVLDVPQHRLTFHHLATRGKHKGTYRARPRSRAFPVLTSAAVLERLEDPDPDDTAFHQNCRVWAARLRKAPRHGP